VGDRYDRLAEASRDLDQLRQNFNLWRDRMRKFELPDYTNAYGQVTFTMARVLLPRETRLCESAIASVSDRLSALIESVGR
jgi:hypothetical protein